MARCGLPRIDGLFEGSAGCAPITRGDSDRESIAAVQDLLRGHGLPAGTPGVFGEKTAEAIVKFRSANRFRFAHGIDTELLRALVEVRACAPLASRPYMTLALDLEWRGLMKVVALTAQLEGQGSFAAINANTDRAGLSFGIIQWAQKPGRLSEILEAFRAADAAEYLRVFGDSAPELLVHTRKPQGGVDARGCTTDACFDLVKEPWLSRFRAAGCSSVFQRAQLEVALRAFERSLVKIRSYAAALDTERAVAFLLDLANQYGDAGARRLCAAVPSAGSVRDRLLAITEASVNRAPARFRTAFRKRRMSFIESDLLSDEAFCAG